MKTTLIQVQATFIKFLVYKFLNIQAKQCCSGQHSNRTACTICSQQEIHHLIYCGISAMHSAMGHVQFVAVWYVRRISNGDTVHSEMQARTILLGEKNESYRTCTGNSDYTFRHDICVREGHAMAADSTAKALLNCCLQPLI